MPKCAVIQDKVVVNIIVANPKDTPPENCTLVLVPNNVFVSIGFLWNGTNFIDFESKPSLPYEAPIIQPEEILVEDLLIEDSNIWL
jgi:hypothetical protein